MIPLSLFPDAIHERRVREISVVGGRKLIATEAFDSYWRFAAERQMMLARQIRGDALVTKNPVLRIHRFTNAYRAVDRVSQFFINEVARGCKPSPNDVVFRTLLFKIFNRIETWTALEQGLREPIHWDTFSIERYGALLSKRVAANERIYSSAYMMPNPAFGRSSKHLNHLDLIAFVINDGIAERIASARSLEQVFVLLRSVPSFGPFLAFQYAIDLNYTELLSFEEGDFVVAGPGALDGIKKCFDYVSDYSPADIIRIMADRANEEFENLGLRFISLWGRPLQLIDCQNIFCEVDKVSRVEHPHLQGESGRSKIKQKYRIAKQPLPKHGFPKRWRLDTSVPIGDVDRVEF